jgi:ATP-dependent DNA helicase RecQ
MKATNLKKNRIRTIKADLLDQKIIVEVMHGRSKKYEYKYNAPILDTSIFEALRQHRLNELDKMIEYTNTKNCKMSFLCDYLGDNNTKHCNLCNSCTKENYNFSMNNGEKELIKKFQDNFFPILDFENTNTNLINGVASSYYGFTNV